MRKYSKFILIIFIVSSACNSGKEFELNKEAENTYNTAIEESKIFQERLSKQLDSMAFESDQNQINDILTKAKKYKLNSGIDCSCVNTFSFSNNKEILLNDKEREQIKFVLTKSKDGFVFNISGTDTAAYYKPNNRIEFLDDKSKRILMFNNYVEHRQKNMILICDKDIDFAKLKLLQNTNIVAISINCLNSFTKEIELTESESKKFRCFLNCN